MSSQPLVTVVIPTFNHGRFVREAVQSAVDQRYDKIDIVVVDDGSTDDTRAIIEECRGPIRYLWQENRGLPAARNTGIRAALGEYIAFLDADDSWVKDFLSASMERIRDDADLGAVHTGFHCIDSNGERLPQINISTVPDDRMYDRLLDGEFFVPSSVVTRRECFARVGLFDEALRGSEDWDMWLRVAKQYRFAGIARPLVNYRIHGSNMSGNPDYMLRYQLMVVEKLFGPLCDSAESSMHERQRAYAAVYRYGAHGYYHAGDRAKSRECLRLALESNPILSDSVDMYYELACADQPLGQRCALRQVNLEANAAQLLAGLREVFDHPAVSRRLRGRRRRAIGHAYFALALLAFGSGRLRLAGRYMVAAAAWAPRLWSRWQLWSTMGKALLGRRVVEALKARLGSSTAASSHG